MELKQKSDFIKDHAAQLGFVACGIAKAETLKTHFEAYEKWIQNGYHADMAYMEKHPEKRQNPIKLVENARSVVSVLYNYYPEKPLPEKDNYKLAKYAYGKDYHFIVKDKLKELLTIIDQHFGPLHSRVFVDTAPVLDRAWAEKAGIGWIGKNSMLINPKHGSYTFIGEIITSLPLAYDEPMNNLCGGCTRCIDACPTQAIISDGVIDSNRCISYWTIENKSEKMPGELKDQFQDYIFGCDICQEVCPWNRFSRPTREIDFRPHPELFEMNKDKWEQLDRESYLRIFKKSAVKRTKLSGLQRNIRFLK
jgi:epoxyqueuosine reductase